MGKPGRPRVIDDKVLGKLEEAFLWGYSDREACLHANINPSTLYDYCNEHKGYSERKELLKNKPKMLAKKNIVEAIRKGDEGSSKWYLERKDDEFSNKTKTEISGSMGIDTEADRKAVIKEAIDHITGKNND